MSLDRLRSTAAGSAFGHSKTSATSATSRSPRSSVDHKRVSSPDEKRGEPVSQHSTNSVPTAPVSHGQGSQVQQTPLTAEVTAKNLVDVVAREGRSIKTNILMKPLEMKDKITSIKAFAEEMVDRVKKKGTYDQSELRQAVKQYIQADIENIKRRVDRLQTAPDRDLRPYVGDIEQQY